MTSIEIALRNGERMTIRRMLPPLGDYAQHVGAWSFIKDELLGGGLADSLLAEFFVGEIDGAVVGSTSYYTPTDTRDVGVVEFVQTAESQRGKGIGGALMAALVESFEGAGGLALYLCTLNPVAGRLYEKHGFKYRVGDGMRRLASGAEDFDATYLIFAGTASVREAVWGDLPRAAVLYNHSDPPWLIKDPLSDSFRTTRYERHFAAVMRRIEDGQGAALVLENPRQRMVGMAAFARRQTYHEQHVATLGFRVHPSYTEQTSMLLASACERAARLGVTRLELPVAEVDRDQADLARAAGFAQEARLRGRVRDGATWCDVLIFAWRIDTDPEPWHAPETFYGHRQPWQTERAAEVGDM